MSKDKSKEVKKEIAIWRDGGNLTRPRLYPRVFVVKNIREEYELINEALKHGCKYKYL